MNFDERGQCEPVNNLWWAAARAEAEAEAEARANRESNYVQEHLRTYICVHKWWRQEREHTHVFWCLKKTGYIKVGNFSVLALLYLVAFLWFFVIFFLLAKNVKCKKHSSAGVRFDLSTPARITRPAKGMNRGRRQQQVGGETAKGSSVLSKYFYLPRRAKNRK